MASLLASRLVATALALAVVSAPSMGKAETLRIGGTGAAIGTMRVLADAYMDGHPGTKMRCSIPLAAGAA